MADQMRPKIVVVESGPVGVAAANGDAEIAVQQLTELLAVPGIDLVGPLPADLQTKIVYAAGIPVGAKLGRRQGASQFLCLAGGRVGDQG